MSQFRLDYSQKREMQISNDAFFYLLEEEEPLDEENLESSKIMAEKIVDDWDIRESVICLFVDFRDIEQIGRQADLVLSHLNNQDFDLARVECNTLQRVVETFRDMVRVDITNIL